MHEFLGTLNFKFLRQSPAVSEQVDLLLRGRPFDEQGLVKALAPLVAAPSDAAPSPEELARELVEAIKDEAWKTLEGDERQIVESRRLHHEEARLIASIGAQRVVIARFDWSPQELHEHLDELARTDERGYASLQEELGPGSVRPERVAALIESPPVWLASGSGQLWLIVGRLAAAHGLFEKAEAAFRSAEQRALPDRAVAVALRGEAAAAAGRLDKARELAEQAHTLDSTNAAASILQARFQSDPDEKLRLLNNARPKTVAARAALDATRALVLLQQRRFDEASNAAEAAHAETPDSWYVQEITALTALYREQDRDATGAGADWAILKHVAEQFLDLRAHMLERGRADEALGFLGRAATAHAAAHNSGEATALLNEALADPHLSAADEDVRLELAACAVALEEWELANALLPQTDGAGAKVLRATVGINRGDSEEALALLDSVVRDDTITSPVRGEAALTRAHAAARGVGEWSPEAAEVIRGFNPTTATVLRARYLERKGEHDEAEKLLIEDGSPAAQDVLVGMAVDAENYSLALERMEAVVQEAPTPFRRVHLAGMLLESGDRTRALVMLAELRVDPDVPHRFRVEATQTAAKDAYERGDYGDAAARAREWLTLDASSRTAAWVLIDSLRKIGDAVAALEADDEHRPIAATDWEVDVAAQLYADNLDAASALERLAGLSARTSDPNPRIAQWISRLAQ